MATFSLFTLGELTKSGSHPEVYNIPSHEAIANLKRYYATPLSY